MDQRRRARLLLAVLVIASLALVTLDFRTQGGPLEGARGVLAGVLAPVQGAAAAVTRPVLDIAGDLSETLALRRENERLRVELAEARSRGRSLTDLQRENDELRAMVGLRERLGVDTVAAQTIGFGPANFEWTATIDAGIRDGVALDMAVLNGDGLVGRVIQTTATTSRVLLAIDPNFAAAARASGEVATVSGRGGDLMLLLPVDPEAELAPGDEVVTTSYEFGVFPAGIPIGVVESVTPGDALADPVAEVRPFVDFTRLDLLLVVSGDPRDPLPVPDVGSTPLDPPRIVESPSPSPSAAPS